MWGQIPFQSVGLVPLSISGAGSPSALRDWVPLQSTSGRIYCKYLAPCRTRPPSKAQSMCGSVLLPIHILGARSPFIDCSVVPFYYLGLDPPSILRG